MREHANEELSLNELDAVAGGEDRDWFADGCAATVEPGSSCWGTDGGCSMCNVNYTSGPSNTSCIYCGARYTYAYGYATLGGAGRVEYVCRNCHKWFTYSTATGEWIETEPRR